MSSLAHKQFLAVSSQADPTTAALLNDISNDIAALIADIFKLLTYYGFHPPCYCPGTKILTSEGEVAVEDLRIGDRVVTASGQPRSIRWIGRRSFDTSRHAAPASVIPVRISAGAFGPSLPHRDLLVSPGHSIFADDSLIPVRFLVNGTTIVQEVTAGVVTYYHVELDAHDILLAEGLPAESYLDTGNRGDFENGAVETTLHPLFEANDWADTCVPLVKSGPTVESVKRRLIDRAVVLGFAITEQPDLHVVADGQRIDGVREGSRYVFSVPQGCADIRLSSNVWVPANLVPASQDDRKLGVCVASMSIDHESVPLGTLSSGWHRFDAGVDSYRWTSGAAAIPSQARSVTVELCGTARYWAASSADAEIALQRAA